MRVHNATENARLVENGFKFGGQQRCLPSDESFDVRNVTINLKYGVVVTEAVHSLKLRKLIDTCRSKIVIRNRKGIERWLAGATARPEKEYRRLIGKAWPRSAGYTLARTRRSCRALFGYYVRDTMKVPRDFNSRPALFYEPMLA